MTISYRNSWPRFRRFRPQHNTVSREPEARVRKYKLKAKSVPAQCRQLKYGTGVLGHVRTVRRGLGRPDNRPLSEGLHALLAGAAASAEGCTEHPGRAV